MSLLCKYNCCTLAGHTVCVDLYGPMIYMKSIPHSIKKKASRIITGEKKKSILEKASAYRGASGVSTDKNIRKFGAALRLSVDDKDACDEYIACLGRTILMPAGPASAWADSRSIAVEELHKSYWLLEVAQQDKIVSILQDALYNSTNSSLTTSVRHRIIDAFRNTICVNNGDSDDDTTSATPHPGIDIMDPSRCSTCFPAIIMEAEKFTGSSGLTTNSHIRQFGDALRSYRGRVYREILIESLGRTILMPSGLNHAWPDSRCLAVSELHMSYWQLSAMLKAKVSSILETALVQSTVNTAIDKDVEGEIRQVLCNIRNCDILVSGRGSREYNDTNDAVVCVDSGAKFSTGVPPVPLVVGAAGVIACLIWKVDFIMIYGIVMVILVILSWRSRSSQMRPNSSI